MSAIRTEAPAPRTVFLPMGGKAQMFTREMVTIMFKCSHSELGRLLQRNMAPLPVRVDGLICWYVDEVTTAIPQVMRTLERWRS